jgi:hypothetical protein
MTLGGVGAEMFELPGGVIPCEGGIAPSCEPGMLGRPGGLAAAGGVVAVALGWPGIGGSAGRLAPG